jgi:hypothetical protein
MSRKARKGIEKHLVREFFETALRIPVRRLVGRQPPRPDVYCVLRTEGPRALVEVELVEYQIDAAAKGGSPGERLQTFWDSVQDSLRRRLTRRRIQVEVSVTLKNPSLIRQRDARALAAELVRFARGHNFSSPESDIVEQFPPRCPLLQQYVRQLRLTKVSYYSIGWRCSNASTAFVGLSTATLARLVRTKAEKGYTWAKNSERWLLICASGRAIVGHAGPRPFRHEWQNPDLKVACRASSFDKIYFWDRPGGWHKRLKYRAESNSVADAAFRSVRFRDRER